MDIRGAGLPDSLLAEVFTNEGVGTLVVEDVNALSPAEQAAGSASAAVVEVLA